MKSQPLSRSASYSRKKKQQKLLWCKKKKLQGHCLKNNKVHWLTFLLDKYLMSINNNFVLDDPKLPEMKSSERIGAFVSNSIRPHISLQLLFGRPERIAQQLASTNASFGRRSTCLSIRTVRAHKALSDLKLLHPFPPYHYFNHPYTL